MPFWVGTSPPEPRRDGFARVLHVIRAAADPESAAGLSDFHLAEGLHIPLVE